MMGGTCFLVGAALLLLLAPAVASAQAKPEECYCSTSVGPGVGRGDGAAYGLPKSGELARCTGLRVAYRMKDVDRRAKLTNRPEPSYTDAARDNHVEGVVRLRVVLCPSGYVSNVSVVKGLPDGLTRRAILAAYKIEFEPAERDGARVAQFVVLEYNFRL
jgi:TonB family protein